jgi:DeoR family deoxyribose operon repressor
MEAAIKSTAMRRAKETVVVADQSKFGIRSTSKFANLSEASTIVSDHAPSKEITAYCQNGGIQLITAEADSML